MSLSNLLNYLYEHREKGTKEQKEVIDYLLDNMWERFTKDSHEELPEKVIIKIIDKTNEYLKKVGLHYKDGK